MSEANYVAQLRREFVPVFAEADCEQLLGTLGIMRGTKMYVDMSRRASGTPMPSPRSRPPLPAAITR